MGLQVGRKPMLLGCSLTCFVFRFMDVLLCEGGYNSVIAANWLDRLFAGACFPAFFTVIRVGCCLTPPLPASPCIPGLRHAPPRSPCPPVLGRPVSRRAAQGL